MTGLETLVIEWRDARQAFFDAYANGAGEPKAVELRTAIFTRLANAEAALMDFARKMQPVPK